jgi:hypothetical protein
MNQEKKKIVREWVPKVKIISKVTVSSWVEEVGKPSGTLREMNHE